MKDFPSLAMQKWVADNNGGKAVDLDGAISKAFRETVTKILKPRPGHGLRAGDKIIFLSVTNAGFAGFDVHARTLSGKFLHCGWADIDEQELLHSVSAAA